MMKDPDLEPDSDLYPGDPKTCGSGSGILLGAAVKIQREFKLLLFFELLLRCCPPKAYLTVPYLSCPNS
jgi:hypothetical protein